jgi:hypothetical protein
MVYSLPTYSKSRLISDKIIISNPAASDYRSLSNFNKKNDVDIAQFKKNDRSHTNFSIIAKNDVVDKQFKAGNHKVSELGKILNFPFVNNKERNVAFEQLKITIDRIHELIAEDGEEDEYGEVVNPTEYAIQKAIELLSEAAQLIPDRFFKAWVSSEDTGGIRLTWSKPELKKQVRLIVPPTSNQPIYLYHEKNDEYGVEYNISAKTLRDRLRRLNSKK